MAADLRALRNYISAKDGTEYENLPEGIVCLTITHNLLKMQMLDIRLDLHATIEQVRHKVYSHCGTSPEHMQLLLLDSNNSLLARLDDDRKMLGYYNVHSGMHLRVIDTNPFSLAKAGGLENASLVEKYKISEDAYNKRENTVRAYKRAQLAKDPNWKSKIELQRNQVPGSDSITHMKVHDRCQVQPGGRRGSIMYLGEVPEIAPGYWVGVHFDEPVGKGNGTVKEKVYFECNPKCGGFIRPQHVEIGDFPPEFMDEDDDFDDC